MLFFKENSGWNIRICITDIAAYKDGPNGTIIMLSNGEHVIVRETMMDIDAILDKVGNKVYSIAELKEAKGV